MRRKLETIRLERNDTEESRWAAQPVKFSGKGRLRWGRGAGGGDIPQCSPPITHNSSTSRSPFSLSRSNVPSNFHFLFCHFLKLPIFILQSRTNLSQYLTHSEQANQDLETHSTVSPLQMIAISWPQWRWGSVLVMPGQVGQRDFAMH